MKTSKLIFPLLSLTLLFGSSCDNKDADSSLVGKWKLIEVLADPGDGSGTFHSVVSNKIINLYSDGTFQSNENMCFMSVNAGSPSSGTYSLNDKTITPNNCNSTGMPPSYSLNFTLDDGTNQLTINYPCIEACAERYVKVIGNE